MLKYKYTLWILKLVIWQQKVSSPDGATSDSCEDTWEQHKLIPGAFQGFCRSIWKYELSKRFGLPKPFAPNVCAPDSTTSSCVLPMASPPLLSIVSRKVFLSRAFKKLMKQETSTKNDPNLFASTIQQVEMAKQYINKKTWPTWILFHEMIAWVHLHLVSPLASLLQDLAHCYDTQITSSCSSLWLYGHQPDFVCRQNLQMQTTLTLCKQCREYTEKMSLTQNHGAQVWQVCEVHHILPLPLPQPQLLNLPKTLPGQQKV